MNQPFPTVLLILSLLGSALPARPVDAADATGPATIVVDGVTCTLADAIRAANDGTTVGGCTGSGGPDVLVLDADVVLASADTVHSSSVGGAHAGLPDVASAMAIQAGSGSVIERDPGLGCTTSDPASFRLLNVTSTGVLQLSGLTLRGGCVAPAAGLRGEGGALHVDGGSLELLDVIAEGNAVVGLGAGAEGGAVFCLDGVVPFLELAIFDSNSATGFPAAGLAALAVGGAVATHSCEVTSVVSTNFENNAATGSSGIGGSGQGGGLFLDSPVATELIGVLFQSNRAEGGSSATDPASSGYGGGVFALSDIEAIRGSVFRDNRATGGSSSVNDGAVAQGGALWSLGVVGEIETSIFDSNHADGGDGGPTAGAGSARGGAVLALGSIGGIHDSYFTANRATSGDAGDGSFAAGGALSFIQPVGVIERTAFAGNSAIAGLGSTASAEGGAIAGIASLRLVSSSFEGNRAMGSGDPFSSGPGGPAEGGAIWTVHGLDVRASTFARNGAIGGADSDGDGVGFGGALWVRAPGAEVTEALSNLFDDNFVQSGAGPITADDCWDEEGNLASLGYNVVEAPGTCAFGAPGDQVGVATATYPAADYGCQTTLPAGLCVPVVAIDQDSPAADGGTCNLGEIEDDAREVMRPVDLPLIPDADDGCDAGALEATDVDGDGYTEAADCAPEDPGVHEHCPLFEDGFESGDTTAWSVTVG